MGSLNNPARFSWPYRRLVGVQWRDEEETDDEDDALYLAVALNANYQTSNAGPVLCPEDNYPIIGLNQTNPNGRWLASSTMVWGPTITLAEAHVKQGADGIWSSISTAAVGHDLPELPSVTGGQYQYLGHALVPSAPSGRFSWGNNEGPTFEDHNVPSREDEFNVGAVVPVNRWLTPFTGSPSCYRNFHLGGDDLYSQAAEWGDTNQDVLDLDMGGAPFTLDGEDFFPIGYWILGEGIFSGHLWLLCVADPPEDETS